MGPLLQDITSLYTHLSNIIIGISFQGDMNSLCHKGTEALASWTSESHIDTVFWQSIITVSPV